MAYEDLLNERNDYIAKLKELCTDGGMGGAAGMEYYAGIITIDKLLAKYFNVKLKFDFSEMVK